MNGFQERVNPENKRNRRIGTLAVIGLATLAPFGLGCSRAGADSAVAEPSRPAGSALVVEQIEDAEAELLVTYLANAGMLVEAGDRKILFDALVSATAPRYVEMSAELRAKLLAAEPPFDGVDLVLATHRHADHFDPEAVATFLTHSPKSIFVSTPGARDELANSVDLATFGDRVRAVLPATGSPERIDDLGVTVIECHHGETRSPPIENLCFLADLEPFTVLHVGDTEMTAADWRSSGFVEATSSSSTEETRVDLALLTSWQMPEGFDTPSVEATIKPRWIAAIHLVPRWPTRDRYPEDRWHRDWATRIAEKHPRIVVFRDSLEKHRFVP